MTMPDPVVVALDRVEQNLLLDAAVIALALVDSRDVSDPDEEETPLDCRMQVTMYAGIPSWRIHTGVSDYDLDHSGFWGASCVGWRDSITELQVTCKDMIEQVMEDMADYASATRADLNWLYLPEEEEEDPLPPPLRGDVAMTIMLLTLTPAVSFIALAGGVS